MNIQTLLVRFEKLFAGMSEEELYLLRGLLVEADGRKMLLSKLDRMIIYRENRKHATHDEFSKIMKGAW